MPLGNHERADHRPGVVGREKVVVGHDGDEPGRRVSDAGISRGRDAPVRLRTVPQVRVRIRQARYQNTGAVGRAVVHDQDFQRSSGVGLRQE